MRSDMSRRFQEIEERAAGDLATVKSMLKRMPDADRALILAWLCAYFDDGGRALRPGDRRTRVVVDRVECWTVRVPKRRAKSAEGRSGSNT